MNCLTLALGILPLVPLSGEDGAQESLPEPTSPYHYRYFKTPRALELVPGYLAVQDRDGNAESVQRLLGDTLAPAGVEPDTLAGWSRVLTPGRTERQLLALASAIAETGVDFVSPVFLEPDGHRLNLTSEILIAFDAELPATDRNALLAMAGSVLEFDLSGLERTYRVETGLRHGLLVLELANDLALREGVTYAESNMVMETRKVLIPNDPQFGQQWGLRNTGQSGGTVDMDMDADLAWDITLGDAAVRVGILDDGIEQSHPDIHQAAGVDFTGNGTGGDPGNSCDNHGTAVAGCVSQAINNGIGGTGVAPGCQSIALRYSVSAVPCNGSGSFQLTWLTNALDHAANNNVRIVNFSASTGSSSSVTSAFNSSANQGVIHFASTGNSGTGSIAYPSSLALVNAVGSISRSGNLSGFSQFGTGIAFVAPGASIRTTDRSGSSGYGNGSYVTVDGTSFSSPYAAGVAALVLSVDSSLSRAAVVNALESTTKDRGAAGYDTTYGWGILDADDAMLAVGCTTPALVAQRNGGSNPNIYTATSPVIGTTMSLSIIDFGHTSTFVFARMAPANVLLSSGQALLVDLASPFLFQIPLPGLPFAGVSFLVPSDTALCGVTAYTQGVLLGGPGLQLTNANDLTLGS